MNSYALWVVMEDIYRHYKEPKETRRCNPANYRGTRLTSHRLSSVLPLAMQSIEKNMKERPDLVLAAWPEIIGPKLATMTEAVSFNDNILIVHVHDSILYSMISKKEKPKIMAFIRQRFPNIHIKSIFFRFG